LVVPQAIIAEMAMSERPEAKVLASVLSLLNGGSGQL
jgi:hypothetical protein